MWGDHQPRMEEEKKAQNLQCRKISWQNIFFTQIKEKKIHCYYMITTRKRNELKESFKMIAVKMLHEDNFRNGCHSIVHISTSASTTAP